MRSYVFQPTHRQRHTGLALMLQSVLLAGSLVATPWLFAAGTGEESHQGHASPVAMPGWTQQLKGQTILEDTIEGRPDRSGNMERQHHRLMEKLEQQAQKDAKAQQTSGAFNEMSMMHQYMGQDGSSFLLMSDGSKDEPVMASGGKCPAGVPTKQYDVSMINIEITLNRWLDFYPGYMYVLTQDLDKVRAEEAKNKASRELDGFDPEPLQRDLLVGAGEDDVRVDDGLVADRLEPGEQVAGLGLRGRGLAAPSTVRPLPLEIPAPASVKNARHGQFPRRFGVLLEPSGSR